MLIFCNFKAYENKYTLLFIGVNIRIECKGQKTLLHFI